MMMMMMMMVVVVVVQVRCCWRRQRAVRGRASTQEVRTRSSILVACWWSAPDLGHVVTRAFFSTREPPTRSSTCCRRSRQRSPSSPDTSSSYMELTPVYRYAVYSECKCFNGNQVETMQLHYKFMPVYSVGLPSPRVGPGHPSFPLVHLLPYLFPFLLFSFFHWLYFLFSSFVHPFPFYQNSPTPFPGRRS